MKKLFFALFSLATLSHGFADEATVQEIAYSKETKMDCEKLMPSEQVFSKGLTSQNQMYFCSKFSKEQRRMAMDMTKQADTKGKMMSADQAVEKVTKDDRVAPMKPKMGGSCPVK